MSRPQDLDGSVCNHLPPQLDSSPVTTRLWIAAGGGVVLMILACWSASALSSDAGADLHTFRADVAGGEVLLTFNDDFSGILRAQIDGANFPSPDDESPFTCGGSATGRGDVSVATSRVK